MAASCYITWNGLSNALSGTTKMTPVASGTSTTAPTTMLQLKSGTQKIRVIEWGYILSASPAAPIQMELIETGTIFATVTTGNILTYNDVTGIASLCPTGTAATGFTATAEGTITATRVLAQTTDLATYFKQQFPLGREPEINASSSLRIRATPGSAAAVSILCYIVWEE